MGPSIRRSAAQPGSNPRLLTISSNCGKNLTAWRNRAACLSLDMDNMCKRHQWNPLKTFVFHKILRKRIPCGNNRFGRIIMNNTGTPLHFFLGANTPQGFVSRYDQLADPTDGWHEFVIIGGPGTGKSTMMKKIVQQSARAAKDRTDPLLLRRGFSGCSYHA
jgi:Cdc6-like AAA superfamily ATPase